jgi:hypothetical protein
LLRDLYAYRKPGIGDFGQGTERFKQEICDIREPATVLWLVKRRPRIYLLIVTHALWNAAQHLVGLVLMRLNLKTIVIRALRRAGTKQR